MIILVQFFIDKILIVSSADNLFSTKGVQNFISDDTSSDADIHKLINQLTENWLKRD